MQGSRDLVKDLILLLAYQVPFPCPCQENSENQMTSVTSLKAF